MGLSDKRKEYLRKYFKEYNKTEKRKKYLKKQNKKYYEANKKDIIKKSTERNKKRDRSIADKKYYKNNKQKIIDYQNKYRKERIKKDSKFKLKITIRSIIRKSLKSKGYSKKSKTFDILGCDYDNFINHMLSQFKEGMTLENHGEWHIDHIIPLAEAKTEEEVFKLNHYTNLQPLWSEENLKKGSKIL